MKTFGSIWVLLGLLAPGVVAQTIDQSKGVDPKVNYQELTKIGPWDDRNYQLSEADLKLLGPEEARLGGSGLPAFFRVEMRKKNPEIGHNGVIYPWSSVQVFEKLYGGFQIDGKIYRRVRREGDRFVVITDEAEDGEESDTSTPLKLLSGDVRMTSPNGAAESAIKINPLNKNLVIAGTNGPTSGQVMWTSSNGGSTWNQAAALPLDDNPLGVEFGDPTVEWSADGSLAYTATLGRCVAGSGCDIWFYRSSDNGATWRDLGLGGIGANPRREIVATQVADKEFLHVDRAPNSPFRDSVYLTWHEGNHLKFARSTDFGDTWSAPIQLSSGNDQRGIGSDITSDKLGRVFYVWPSFTSQRILVSKSLDGGSFFQGPVTVANTEAAVGFPIPAMDARGTLVYTAADTDLTEGPFANRAYIAYTDSTAPTFAASFLNHARVRIAFSADAGNNWTVLTPHATADADAVDRFHPWIAVDAIGTVHLIYYETLPNNRLTVQVVHQKSFNGGASWTTPEVITSAVSPALNDLFEFGDYNGLDVVGNLALASFTDNRDETGGNAASKDVFAASGNTQRVMSFQSVAAEDGYVTESDETSNVGGAAAASGSTGSGLRAGDTSSRQQYKSILSFDTSAIPDGAKITAAQLRLKRGTMVGSVLNLGAMRADIKTGGFGGSTSLAASDFQAAATASASCIFNLPLADGDDASCGLNLPGLLAVNSTGTTQARIYFSTDDNNNLFYDYLGFFPGEAASGDRPTLTVTFEPQ